MDVTADVFSLYVSPVVGWLLKLPACGVTLTTISSNTYLSAVLRVISVDVPFVKVIVLSVKILAIIYFYILCIVFIILFHIHRRIDRLSHQLNHHSHVVRCGACEQLLLPHLQNRQSLHIQQMKTEVSKDCVSRLQP